MKPSILCAWFAIPQQIPVSIKPIHELPEVSFNLRSSHFFQADPRLARRRGRWAFALVHLLWREHYHDNPLDQITLDNLKHCFWEAFRIISHHGIQDIYTPNHIEIFGSNLPFITE